MGQFSDLGDESSAIRSVDVGTVSALEDMTKLLVQDTLGVKSTKLCTCKDNELKENKFIKSIADSTEIDDGRVQVRMPWSEHGPPRRAITMLRTNVCCPQKKPSRERTVSRTYKTKFRNYSKSLSWK